jgi:DedD protein
MMERALKERIIGAAVLVLVVVLLVPVFLDGTPGGDEIVSERVPLPGQAEQKSQTVVLDRDRKDPVPVATGSTPAQKQKQEPPPKPLVKQAEPETLKPDPDPEPEPARPAAEESAANASSTGMWAVQLGSFGNQENAERLAADLRKQGHAAFLSQVMTSDGQRHRVRIGPQKDRAAAEAVAASLKTAGYDGKVLPHP